MIPIWYASSMESLNNIGSDFKINRPAGLADAKTGTFLPCSSPESNKGSRIIPEAL